MSISDRIGRSSIESGTALPKYGSPSRAAARYLMALLCAASFFNFLDRQIFSILLVPIKKELGVSDTAMGLLTGASFAVLYVIAGLPIARVVDHGNRTRLFTACLIVWSIMTMLCGRAQTYGHILIARMGVAVGEAGSMPASYSLISDIMPFEKRTGAIGVLYFSSGLGIAASLYLGGFLNDAIGWRMTMIAVAVPGLAIGILMAVTVKEPARTGAIEIKPSVLEVLRTTWRYPSFRCVLVAVTMGSFAGYGILGWAPTFLIRVHHLTTTGVGALMGFGMVCSAIGSLTAGMVTNRLSRNGVRALFWVPVIGPLLSIPPLMVFLSDSDTVTLWVSYALYQGLFATWLPSIFAIATNLAGSRSRGLVIMVVTIFQNVGGVALGPLVPGILNDHLAPTLGSEAVRYSLYLLSSGIVFVAVSSMIGVRFIERDMATHKLIDQNVAGLPAA